MLIKNIFQVFKIKIRNLLQNIKISPMANNLFIREDFYEDALTRYLKPLEQFVYNRFYFFAVKSNSQIGMGKITKDDFAYQSNLELEELLKIINALIEKKLILCDKENHLFLIRHYFKFIPWAIGKPVYFVKKILREFEEKPNIAFWTDFVDINFKNLVKLNQKMKNDTKNKDNLNLDCLLSLKPEKSTIQLFLL